MRLLIHGINYAPELIGIGRYTGEMGAWLAARGHAVTVLTAPPYYPQWRVQEEYRQRSWLRERRDGVEVLRAPLYVPTRVTGRSRVLLELSFGLSCLYWWPYLLRQRWDAVLGVCPPLQCGLLPALLAARQGVPFIFHLQDLQVDAAQELGLLKQPVLLACLKRAEGFLLGRAQAVTTISEGMAVRLKDKGVPAARLHLMPNWADLDGLRPSPRENPWRTELGMTSEVLVLYAGNLGEKQGLEVILESARLTRPRSDICYVVAGDGAARDRLLGLARHYALDNFLVLPLQSKERYAWLMATGDIHLVIQRGQAADLVMPSKLANILAAGRPFIATARAGTELARITQDSQAGVPVPPEDDQALAQAVLKLAADADLREEMGLKARRYAEAWLGREAILARLEDLLYRLSQSPRP